MQNPQTLEDVVGLARNESCIDMQLQLREKGDEVSEIDVIGVN